MPDRVRIVLDLSAPVDYKLDVFKDPSRLVLNIGHARLATTLQSLPLENTPVAQVSSNHSEDSRLRLVFNMNRDTESKSFLLKPYKGRGDRLVLDLYSPAAKEKPSAVATQNNAPERQASSYPETTRAAPSPRALPASTAPEIDFSGTWQQEAAIETDDFGGQKFEAIIEPRVDVSFDGGGELTAVARVRLDTEGDLGPDASRPDNYSSFSRPWYNNKNAGLSLREFYLDKEWGRSFWRVGKQQIVWGQADGIKVLDVVNPQSFREFIMDDFDDSRIPLWTVNIEVAVGDDNSLQFLWLPDTTYHELAEQDTPYAFTSSKLVPRPPSGIASKVLEADRPDNAFSDSDAGIRYSAFAQGWDVTLNYLYHYQDFPVPYQELHFDETGLTALLIPDYERNHLIGGTASNAFGNVTLRAELAYSTDTFHLSSDTSSQGVADSKELASVVGLDWQLGLQDILVSAQWFQSHLLDYSSDILRDRTEHNVSLLYRQTFDNETWQFDALTLYSMNNSDSWVQLKLRYALRSNLDIWLGGDIFSGDDDGLYGQFSQRDRITMGMELGF